MVHLNDAPAKPPREIEDADRLLPGRGVIRLAELIGTLRAAGYDGPWSLETFNPEYWARPAEEVASEGRAALARVLDAPPARGRRRPSRVRPGATKSAVALLDELAVPLPAGERRRRGR